MFFDTVKRGKPGKFAAGTTRNPYLAKARRSIVDLMTPVLAQCERDGLVLVNKYAPSQRLTPTQLVAEWKKGRYIRGPVCWRLVKAEENQR